MTQFIVDASDIVDYKFDFAALTNSRDGAIRDWLEAGDTIDTFVITETGLVLGDGSTVNDTMTPPSPAKADSDTSIVIWCHTITDGATVACKIRTTGGRVIERTITFVLRAL